MSMRNFWIGYAVGWLGIILYITSITPYLWVPLYALGTGLCLAETLQSYIQDWVIPLRELREADEGE